MNKQWDVRELEWYGVDRVQVGDTVKNEDGSVSKIVMKHDNAVWIDADKSVKTRLHTIIRLTIKILCSPFWLIMFVLKWLVLIAFDDENDKLTLKDFDAFWNYWRIND